MKDTDILSGFNFSFDSGLDIMGNVMGDAEEPEEPDVSSPFLPNTEGRSEFLPPDPERVPTVDAVIKNHSEEYALRPAEEKTHDLFTQMRPQRVTLHSIIRLATGTPRTTAELDDPANYQYQRKYSIYTTANFCTMLEAAGALKRVFADGSDYVQTEVEPDIEIIDGEEFYVPSMPPEIYWLATQAGIDEVAKDNPLERVEKILNRHEELKGIYKRVLNMAAAEDGVTIEVLSEKIDRNPIIAEPRNYFVQYFVENLEATDSIVWSNNKWHITEVGKQALEMLADVEEDTFEPDELNADELPTITNGVIW